MSVADGDLLAHSNHGTAWLFGFCQARDALMLAAVRRNPLIIYRECTKIKDYRQEPGRGFSPPETT